MSSSSTSCDPCTPNVGGLVTVNADEQDPDRASFTFAWAASVGAVEGPSPESTATVLLGTASTTALDLDPDA